jgi:hypothetical protein
MEAPVIVVRRVRKTGTKASLSIFSPVYQPSQVNPQMQRRRLADIESELSHLRREGFHRRPLFLWHDGLAAHAPCRSAEAQGSHYQALIPDSGHEFWKLWARGRAAMASLIAESGKPCKYSNQQLSVHAN